MSDQLHILDVGVAYPTDHKYTVVEPKLLLTLTDPAANDEEEKRDSTKRPGGDAHQRTMRLTRVAPPVIELGRHCVRSLMAGERIRLNRPVTMVCSNWVSIRKACTLCRIRNQSIGNSSTCLKMQDVSYRLS